MCGIVGLLIRSPSLREQLGRLVTPMFETMSARGPDSGGCAFFLPPVAASTRRFSLLATQTPFDWQHFETRLSEDLPSETDQPRELSVRGNLGLLTADVQPAEFRRWLADEAPAIRPLGTGRMMNVMKDVGDPREIARRFQFDEIAGSHCVGHTRMATESDVTVLHTHPYTAGEDFCLVHNGSLSNPYMLRRKLEREGLSFETDNDTEAACRFLQWRLALGDDLAAALDAALAELDGFYTLLMATSDQLCLVRDAFACKPAVVAETDDYVAVSSEYRSMAHLPGIEHASLFEPKPEEVYLWTV